MSFDTWDMPAIAWVSSLHKVLRSCTSRATPARNSMPESKFVLTMMLKKNIMFRRLMTKMFAKLPAFCGWTNEGMKGSTLSNLIQFTCTTCELHAIEGLKTRQDSTATVLVRESCVPDLMKASGRDGHLPVDECLSLADDHLTSCEKKQKPRFAIRLSAMMTLKPLLNPETSLHMKELLSPQLMDEPAWHLVLDRNSGCAQSG